MIGTYNNCTGITSTVDLQKESIDELFVGEKEKGEKRECDFRGVTRYRLDTVLEVSM